MRRPICIKCKREMIVIENDFLVKDKAVGDFPSTYWNCDLYECPECKIQIVTGFGNGMSAEKMARSARAKTALEFTQ